VYLRAVLSVNPDDSQTTDANSHHNTFLYTSNGNFGVSLGSSRLQAEELDPALSRVRLIT
jgi:hypothetical protein